MRIRGGKLALSVAQSIFKGEISALEAASFMKARFNGFGPQFTLQGITFKNTDSLVWRHACNIFIYSEYTPSPTYAIAPSDIVVDIGAHQGVFTAFAASKTEEKVVAFEPEERNFKALRHLIAVNKIENAELHNKAVAGSSGQLKLYKGLRTTRHTLTGEDVTSGEKLADFDLVPAVSLDTALKGLDRIDFLKMDCEGAEFNIIDHTDSYTLKKISRIVIEYHKDGSSSEVADLTEKLTKAGFLVTNHPKEGLPLGMIFAARSTQTAD